MITTRISDDDPPRRLRDAIVSGLCWRRCRLRYNWPLFPPKTTGCDASTASTVRMRSAPCVERWWC